MLEQLSIATDIQFHVFKFACHVYLQKKLIVHIQCLLRVDGSLVAGVFLTSFFCVVPESPYSSDAASSSLLVAWYSNCFSAGSTTSGFRNWWLFSSIDPYAVFQTNLGHSYSLSNCCCNVSYDSILCAEPNSSPHKVRGGFISPKLP